MLCEKCKKYEATVHITSIVGDELTKRDFCEACGNHYVNLSPSAIPPNDNWDKVVDGIVVSDARFSKSAYCFLRSALGIAIQKHYVNASARDSHHISAARLLEALRELAIKEFGKDAKTKLNGWGIFECEDFGEIVFNLINAGMLVKQEQDSKADFHGGYDFDAAFPQ